MGYYIYSGVQAKVLAKEQNEAEQGESIVSQVFEKVEDMTNNIAMLVLLFVFCVPKKGESPPAKGLVWNLAADAAVYMFFVCALCGIY